MPKVSEIYASVQGEGPRVGIPTIFVRFGGCNLRCAGWPCDTPHAIFPEKYRKEWEPVGITGLMDRITAEAVKVGATNICFTGGEPFIQPARDLQTLARDLVESGYHVECFSNGTRPYGTPAIQYIDFVVDWKLPGSGEDPQDLVRLDNLANMSYSNRHAIKFTIKDWADFVCAKQLYEDHKLDVMGFEVFYGIVWGHLENAELIKWVQEAALPWRLNVQVHNHIWDRSQRGI